MPLLLLLFVVVPIAELYVIVQVGGAIGVLPTLGLLIAASLVGAALARSQSRAAWERFNRALAEGRVPGREVFDGAMIIVGGALLLTPGFLTDFLGLALLLPPTRALLRRLLSRVAGRRTQMAWRVMPFGAGQRPPGHAPGRHAEWEGTAREIHERGGELEPGQRDRSPDD